MSDYNSSISRVFTKKVIGELLDCGKSDMFDYVVKRYVNDPECKTHGQIISEIYCQLGHSYRNEYYYTNTLLNKLLVGIHNVNTTTALSQVRIAKHIADFVMINGEGCVYEIKSDLDNFDRLSDQIYDYFKAFSKVSVLASQHERDKVEILLDRMGDMGTAVSEIGGKPAYIALAGYSLAGLFAVYAMYRTKLFSRIASASGSLWYPGFMDYAKSNELAALPEKLYLSLGDRESRTRNQIMAKVEQNTRDLHEYYKSLGIDTIFELNEGNHFKDAGLRIAKAITWITD